MSLKLNVSMIIISFLCMINSRILHVSIDIVIQFSSVEMYKDFLVLDTCYGYLFIILYNDLLVALENILSFDHLIHLHNTEFLFEFLFKNVFKLFLANEYSSVLFQALLLLFEFLEFTFSKWRR